MAHNCWMCPEKFANLTDLNRHMASSAHTRLRVICPWCIGQEKTFTRIADLKVHAMGGTGHPEALEQTARFFTSANGFYLARFPKDYNRIVKISSWDSDEACEARRLVSKWCASQPKSEMVTLHWKAGWVEALSPVSSKRSRDEFDSDIGEDPDIELGEGVTRKVFVVEEREEKETEVNKKERIVREKTKEVRRKADIGKEKEKEQKQKERESQEKDKEREQRRKEKEREEKETREREQEKEARMWEEADRERERLKQRERESKQKEKETKEREAEESKRKEEAKRKEESERERERLKQRERESKQKEKETKEREAEESKRKEEAKRKEESEREKEREAKRREKEVKDREAEIEAKRKEKEIEDRKTKEKEAEEEAKRKEETERKKAEEKKEKEQPSMKDLFGESDTSDEEDEDTSGSETDREDDLDQNLNQLEERERAVRKDISELEGKLKESELKKRAKEILRVGVMPLCPPGRRHWTEEAIAITHTVAGQPFIEWPPRGFQTMTADEKLLAVEYHAMSIEHSRVRAFPRISRQELLDRYNFLILPGTKKACSQDKACRRARFYNHQVIRGIAQGQKPSREGLELLETLEALKDKQKNTQAYKMARDLSLTRVPLRLDHE